MTRLNKQTELKVQVQVKRPRRFKAGAELSGAVNLVAIDVEEDATNETESLKIQLTIGESFDTEDSHCKN